ncbi:uncharacterized protein [Rhodnius prolixus]|uniref:uncharacterized protein n=1 Tax=Rhodnius prolixus TaxID=13249 RepID=UPI003D18ADAB
MVQTGLVGVGARKGPSRETHGALRQYKIGVPCKKIASDMAGPSPDFRRRVRCNLAAMDYFGKWAEAYVVADQDASTAAAASTVYQIFGIRGTRTTPLHPHSDGMMEQLNKAQGGHQRSLGKEHQEDWKERTPPIKMEYQSAVQETKEQMLASIVFGRELQQTGELLFGSLEAEESDENSYTVELRLKWRAAREKVRGRKRLDSDRTRTLYDRQVDE